MESHDDIFHYLDPVPELGVLDLSTTVQLLQLLYLDLQLLAILDADGRVLLRLLLEGFELRSSDIVFTLEWILGLGIFESELAQVGVDFLFGHVPPAASGSLLLRKLLHELARCILETLGRLH